MHARSAQTLHLGSCLWHNSNLVPWQTMALVSRSTATTNNATEINAKRSIERFVVQGFTALDPNNNDHVQAFIRLRAMQSRCDGKTLVHFLKNKQSNVHAGQKLSVEYWAVPKKNFPGGLPDCVKEAPILCGELFEMEAASGASMIID